MFLPVFCRFCVKEKKCPLFKFPERKVAKVFGFFTWKDVVCLICLNCLFMLNAHLHCASKFHFKTAQSWKCLFIIPCNNIMNWILIRWQMLADYSKCQLSICKSNRQVIWGQWKKPDNKYAFGRFTEVCSSFFSSENCAFTIVFLFGDSWYCCINLFPSYLLYLGENKTNIFRLLNNKF